MAGLHKLADEYLLNNAWLRYVKDSSGNSITPFKITFNANYGSDVPASFLMYGDNGGLIHDYPAFKNDDATLLGWYTDTPDRLWNFKTDKISSDITLYAAWKKIDADVTKSGSTYTIVTKLSNIDLNSSIIVAGYKDDTFEIADSKVHSGENKTFTITGDFDKIKIMVWNMDSLYPLHCAKVITTNSITN